MTPEQREFDCGLEGREEDPVLTGRFNRWLAFALRHHILPLKDNMQSLAESISKTHHTLETHIRDEERTLRKVLIVTIMTLLGTCAGLIIYIWQFHLER